MWDEENRLLALSDNGFVSNYWYDAAGERTVKTFGGAQGVSVNGLTSAATTGTTNFTAYISPYLVLSNGGYYSKHIYIGSQRIASKLGSSDIFDGSNRNPLTDATANNQNYASKLSDLTTKIKTRYDSLGVVYRGAPQGSAGLITSAAGRIATPLKYFYHSDHLGSSSLITDADGNVTQHIEYVPFGEVFVEERNNSWSTPYKFNAKELDEETGLYYYGARYYNPRSSVWLSVDPLAEKFAGLSAYVYCHNNPIVLTDPDGKDDTFDSDGKNRQHINNSTNYILIRDKSGLKNITEYNYSKENVENRAMLVNIGSYYLNQNGVNEQVGIFDVDFSGAGGHTNKDTRQIEICVDPNGKINSFAGNSFNLRSMFKHEEYHKKDPDLKNTTSMSELKALMAQVSDPTFLNISKDYANAVAGYTVSNATKAYNSKPSETESKVNFINTYLNKYQANVWFLNGEFSFGSY